MRFVPHHVWFLNALNEEKINHNYPIIKIKILVKCCSYVAEDLSMMYAR